MPISEQPQPTPAPKVGDSPSLWLYVALLASAAGLIWAAFAQQSKPDWPGLLINLASGLIGSVIILVVIDQRLRSSEVAALSQLPTRATQRLTWLLFPTRRTGERYATSLLVALDSLIGTKIDRGVFADLEAKVRQGVVVLAEVGGGKTTWTQMVAASLSRQYLAGQTTGRLPILFPLARWHPDRTLDDALFETFRSFAPCRRRMFDRLLRAGIIVVLLDGYDELWNRRLPLESEVGRIRSLFPTVAWTVTSRPDKPTPDFGEVVTLLPPTDDELAAIRRRANR